MKRDAVQWNSKIAGEYFIDWIQLVQPSMRRLDQWSRLRGNSPILNSDSIRMRQSRFQDFIQPAISLFVSGNNLNFQGRRICSKIKNKLSKLPIQRRPRFR